MNSTPSQNPNSIILPSSFSSFEFNKLTLESPISIPGGSFFAKLLYNGTPLIIQTTRAGTKQGINKIGKKYYCDLVFDNSSELIIHWFENLENKCKQIIYDKTNIWFETPLTQDDIDDTFISIIKVFKSGRLYNIRTSIKTNTEQDIPLVKIYNESYSSIPIEQITNETYFNCLLEIKGIRFSAKNFQIEMETKHIMVLEEDKILNNYFIHKVEPAINTFPVEKIALNNTVKLNAVSSSKTDDSLNEQMATASNISTSTNAELSFLDAIANERNKYNNNNNVVMNTSVNDLDMIDADNDMENLTSASAEKVDVVDSNNDNREIDMNDIIDNLDEENDRCEDEDDMKEVILEVPSETINLKKKEDYYYELYKDAKIKAKEAKKNAILAYLAAKNIKNTYMLELGDDNSDFDDEIEDTDETDLNEIHT